MIAFDRSKTLVRYRFRWPELLIWIAALLFYFLFPQYIAVGTDVLVMALFAISYDLAIGFAGILTLGHALYFGIGAYAAGLIAKFAWSEAITGAIAAATVGAAVAAALGPFLLRLSGLPLIMVTLGINVIVLAAAGKAGCLTGGDDGLTGFKMAPLLGVFRWSIFGTSHYLYVLAWLFAMFYLLRRIVSSPFGVALQGIRENGARMRLLGTPVLRYLVVAYVVSAAIAAVAGALHAQTNAFVGLNVLSLDTTLDGLVMVVMGGIGTLYGGVVGAPTYLLVKYFAQQWNPYSWMFVVGAMLILIVRLGRGGLAGWWSHLLSSRQSVLKATTHGRAQ